MKVKYQNKIIGHVESIEGNTITVSLVPPSRWFYFKNKIKRLLHIKPDIDPYDEIKRGAFSGYSIGAEYVKHWTDDA